jgi:general secretion pathway protein D
MRFAVRCIRGFVLALAAAALLHAGALPGQEPTGGPDDTITLNFVNADIHAVVKAVAEMTGRNFIIDPRVQGTVTIIAPKPVPRNLVFPILLSALRVQGFAAVGGDLGYINVVPEADAKFYASAPARARADQIVTEVFRLQFESAAQLIATLRPLISPNNVINAFPASNTIVVTDYASNLARVRKVIATVDQPQPAQVMTIGLRHAAAIDVGQAVQRLMPELAQPTGPGAAPRMVLTVDARTNSLLVRAEHPALAKRVQQLADSLDLPGAAGGNIHVVYLKNAQADRLAEVLRGILTGQPVARPAAAALPATVPPGGAPPPPPPPATQPVAAAAAGTGGTGGAALGALANASIQAHAETNSLVIIAPDAVYRSLRGVIEQLDARRAQVYVEALIVEVLSTKAAEFGIQWQWLNNPSPTGTSGFGIQNFNATTGSNIGQVAREPTALGQGLSLGVIRGTITLGGVEILNIAALIRALEQDNTANILSTPTLLTLDNEEARIQVGQNIPIVTGSFSTLSGAGGAVVNPFQTFERRDIGVTLKVRPQIAEGGTIKLAIYQEVSSIFNATNPTGIILNKRSLESSVLVDDGQIIVLGGLISDDVQTGKQAVPVLGDIPGLGYLFRYDNRRREKINLMIFLRPVVLRDVPTAASLTGNRYDVIRGIQGSVQATEHPPLPSMPGPTLPDELPPLVPGQPLQPQRARIPTPPAPAPVGSAPRPEQPAVNRPTAPPPFDEVPPP